VIFKKSDKIQFVSTIEGLESIEECLPRPAKHFIPQWFKDIPSTKIGTVKDCPSFPDYFSQGYIIPMWCDTKLRCDNDRWLVETSTPLVSWGHHGNDQFINYTNANFNGVDGQFVFKAHSPWKIITPPGWSVLQLPLFYHFNKDWSVLPGVTDTDIDQAVNQQVLYHGNGKEIIIKRGEPFVLYVPFKRSQKLKKEIRYQTEKDKKIFNKTEFNLHSAFMPNGIYRKMQRKRDKELS